MCLSPLSCCCPLKFCSCNSRHIQKQHRRQWGSAVKGEMGTASTAFYQLKYHFAGATDVMLVESNFRMLSLKSKWVGIRQTTNQSFNFNLFIGYKLSILLATASRKEGRKIEINLSRPEISSLSGGGLFKFMWPHGPWTLMNLHFPSLWPLLLLTFTSYLIKTIMLYLIFLTYTPALPF